MNIKNLTEINTNKLINYLPKGLEIEEIVFLPDFTPLENNIPTGTAVFIKNKDWRRFAISDIGCGISVYETSLFYKDFNKNLWNEIYSKLKRIKRNHLGSLGGGNHFLDLMKRDSDNKLFIVIVCVGFRRILLVSRSNAPHSHLGHSVEKCSSFFRPHSPRLEEHDSA